MGTGQGLTSHPRVISGHSYAANGLNDESTIGLLVSGVVKTPVATRPVEGQQATASAPFHFGTVFDYHGSPGEPSSWALLVGGGTARFIFTWSEALRKRT